MKKTLITAVLMLLIGLYAPLEAQTPLIQRIVGEVSVSEYTSAQLAIEDMGLGLYGGPAYNQGYRGRNASNTGGTDALGCQECRLYLQDRFTANGLSVSTQGTYNNAIGEITGEVTPHKIYIVCGHYDHVSGVPMPGGDDNASGTAAVLEAARIMSQYRFKSTIRFIGFNAEEDGLKGSEDYVDNSLVPSGQDVRGVINLDMILRPEHSGNLSLPIDLDIAADNSADDLAWVQTFKTATGVYVPTLSIDATAPYTILWGYSDHVPFSDANYPAFLAIENQIFELLGFPSSNDYYHTGEDWSQGLAGSAYDYVFAADVVRAAVATLAQEAEILPEPIIISATTDYSWVYQNTAITTADGHKVLLTIAIDDDPNGNSTFAVQVADTVGGGEVTAVATADPMVWEIIGSRVGADVGDATVQVTVSGNEFGGEGLGQVAVDVRLLGDIDGSDFVNVLDKLEMNKRLNGMDTSPFNDDRHFDLDANGVVSVLDKLVLNLILNSMTIY